MNPETPREKLAALRLERERLRFAVDELLRYEAAVKDARAALGAWEDEHGDDLADLESLCDEVPGVIKRDQVWLTRSGERATVISTTMPDLEFPVTSWVPHPLLKFRFAHARLDGTSNLRPGVEHPDDLMLEILP